MPSDSATALSHRGVAHGRPVHDRLQHAPSPLRLGTVLRSSAMPGKVAIVTGGGTGIGRASALALGRDGYSVVIAGRRPGPLDQTVRDGSAAGFRLRAVVADVSDPAEVQRLFDQAVRHFGRVDLLFNNAGRAAPPVPLEDVSFADWQSVVGVNLTGAFLCTQAAFRVMKEQDPRGGRIINNGSLSAYSPRPRSAPYTATKHAVSGLTKATSLDGRGYGIACGQIDIGNAATDLSGWLSTEALQPDGSTRPEPMIDADLVADAVVHMANLPLTANVQFMTLMATTMPFIGRG
jgi:NAD(P)-dependent dehydrogenase (short-subunit alcohol dehydrogenase family)